MHSSAQAGSNVFAVCADGLYCDAGDICQSLEANGATCTAGDERQSDTCTAGKCAPDMTCDGK